MLNTIEITNAIRENKTDLFLITEKAKSEIETNFDLDQILEFHLNGFDIVLDLFKKAGYANIGLFITVRDAIQNIILENFQVVENQIVKKTNQAEKEKAMFGCTIAEMKQDFALFNQPDDAFSMQARAIGILSDVQETIQRGGDAETIRQMLNQSKFWMSEVKAILRKF